MTPSKDINVRLEAINTINHVIENYQNNDSIIPKLANYIRILITDKEETLMKNAIAIMKKLMSIDNNFSKELLIFEWERALNSIIEESFHSNSHSHSISPTLSSLYSSPFSSLNINSSILNSLTILLSSILMLEMMAKNFSFRISKSLLNRTVGIILEIFVKVKLNNQNLKLYLEILKSLPINHEMAEDILITASSVDFNDQVSNGLYECIMNNEILKKTANYKLILENIFEKKNMQDRETIELTIQLIELNQEYFYQNYGSRWMNILLTEGGKSSDPPSFIHYITKSWVSLRNIIEDAFMSKGMKFFLDLFDSKKYKNIKSLILNNFQILIEALKRKFSYYARVHLPFYMIGEASLEMVHVIQAVQKYIPEILPHYENPLSVFIYNNLREGIPNHSPHSHSSTNTTNNGSNGNNSGIIATVSLSMIHASIGNNELFSSLVDNVSKGKIMNSLQFFTFFPFQLQWMDGSLGRLLRELLEYSDDDIRMAAIIAIIHLESRPFENEFVEEWKEIQKDMNKFMTMASKDSSKNPFPLSFELFNFQLIS